MSRMEAIDRIITLLDDPAPDTTNTSMRILRTLRDAAGLTADLGAAPSSTALMTGSLRSAIEAFVMQAALDEHYRSHPHARPGLADLALAAAEQDGHPLASEPERLARAAEQIVVRHPAAGPDEVILWAEAQLMAAS